MDIKKPGAILFDMDGVIFDTENMLIECWLPIAEKYNIKNIVETCKMCIGITNAAVKDIFLSVYGPDFPHEKYQAELHEEFARRAKNGMPMKPGVRELLEYLKTKNIPLAIASSTRRELVTTELQQVDLLKYFDKIVGGDMVKRSKPAPDIFLLAAETVGVAPENCLVIEDSFNGIIAAKDAGCGAIMVPDILQPNEKIRNLADAILPSLLDVKEFLFSE